MDPELIARYRSSSGATAYRHKYERSLSRRLSNRRELSIVRQALARVKASGHLLDCPCGAGRLTPTLLTVADRVTCADMSESMVAEARDALSTLADAGRVDFAVASALDLPFETDTFDVAVCHRLLHHMPTADERGAALRELARVAKRYVICSFSDDTVRKARQQRRRGVKRRRYPLTPETFFAEARAAGLEPEGSLLHLNGWFSLVTVTTLRVVDAPASAAE